MRQAAAHRLDPLAVFVARGTIHRNRDIRLGVEAGVFVRVVEHAAAVVVDAALGCGTVGEQDGVPVQFDVEILDALDLARLGDRDAVDERLGRDQHAVEQ